MGKVARQSPKTQRYRNGQHGERVSDGRTGERIAGGRAVGLFAEIQDGDSQKLCHNSK
jgi:hypothetical protein